MKYLMTNLKQICLKTVLDLFPNSLNILQLTGVFCQFQSSNSSQNNYAINRSINIHTKTV